MYESKYTKSKPKYVNVNDALLLIDEALFDSDGIPPDGVMFAIKWLEKLPAADVRKNIHGEWIYDGNRGRFPACKCSICGAYENADWAAVQDGARFCPHCGAEMK